MVTRPLREPAPTGREFDRRLDEAFGPEVTALRGDLGAPTPATNEPSRLQRIAEVLADHPPADLDEALAFLQANLPRVGKGETARVEKDGQLKYTYQYADLTDVSEAILPLLGALGLSWRCRPTLAQLPGETGYRFVLAYRLRHKAGGPENEETGWWPLPDRTDPQVVGSAITYARRYCLCAVTGLAPGGDDEDGGKAASDASKRGDTLHEASFSMPPADAEQLVALLEPAALTPVAQYPEMWKRVVARRAATKDSPVEAEGRRLTWAELFGFSLARRVEMLRTPAECREFWAAIRDAGGDQAFPWLWDGRTAGGAVLAHGKEIARVQEQAVEVLQHAIASAETLDHLTTVRAAIDLAHEEWKIHDPKPAELRAFADEREAAILRAQPAPDATEATQPGDELPMAVQATDDAVEAGASAPWAPGEREAAIVVAAGHPLHFSKRAAQLEYLIWEGMATSTATGEIDGAAERGEIEPDEVPFLRGILNSRPQPGAGVAWLEWQTDTAHTLGQLDRVERDAAQWDDTTIGSTVTQRVKHRRRALQGGRYTS